MRFPLRRAFAGLLLAGLLSGACLFAQSDDENSVPLGDIARALRKQKEEKQKDQAQPEAPSAHTVIDNDNFSQIMEQAEKDREKGSVNFLFDGVGKDIHVASPDVSCSLSFNAKVGALLTDPFVPQELPHNELASIDGPAVINGSALQITIHNGTPWNLREITVSLTILRPGASATAGPYNAAKLIPAADQEEEPAGKRSDFTVLYHVKGTAAPFSTAVFRQDLGAKLDPDQDWHWAIVQAQGIPPQTTLPKTDTTH